MQTPLVMGRCCRCHRCNVQTWICLTGKALEPKKLHLSRLSEASPSRLDMRLESSESVFYLVHAVKGNRKKMCWQERVHAKQPDLCVC